MNSDNVQPKVFSLDYVSRLKHRIGGRGHTDELLALLNVAIKYLQVGPFGGQEGKESEYNHFNEAFAALEGKQLGDAEAKDIKELAQLVEADFSYRKAQLPKIRLGSKALAMQRVENGKVSIIVTLESVDDTCPPVSDIELTMYSDDGKEQLRCGVPGILSSNRGMSSALSVKLTCLLSDDEIFAHQCVRYFQISLKTYAGTLIKNYFPNLQRISTTFPYEPLKTGTFGCFIDQENPEIFVGREDYLSEMSRIARESKGGRWYVIRGQRRSGKSSLFDRFADKFEDRGELSECSVCTKITFYGEFDDGGETPCEVLVNELGRKLTDAGFLSEQWMSSQEFARLKPKERIEAMRLCLPASKTWCVEIDEFTEVYETYYLAAREERRAHVVAFMKLLKELHKGGAAFNLFLVVQNSIDQFLAEFGWLCPFGRIIPLEGLSIREINLLVDKIDDGERVGEGRIRAPELECLRLETQGNPLMLLYLLEAIVAAMNRKKSFAITQDVVKTAVWLLSNKNSKYGQDIANGETPFRPGSFQSFFRLAINVEGCTDATLHDIYFKLAHGEALTVEDGLILEELKKRGIVIIEKGQWRIAVRLFERWLADRYAEDCPVEEFIQ